MPEPLTRIAIATVAGVALLIALFLLYLLATLPPDPVEGRADFPPARSRRTWRDDVRMVRARFRRARLQRRQAQPGGRHRLAGDDTQVIPVIKEWGRG